MIINSETLDLAYRGFKTVYTDAFMAAPAHADRIAMRVPSASRDETYSWLGQFPQMREWIGPRHVKGLKAHGFTIVNKSYEATVSVPRNDIADDRLGNFKPVFSEMGQLARRHSEELVFGLLKAGFTTACFDGQYFFDTDHPLEVDNVTTTVSNHSGGAGTAWYLLDTTRAVRPVILQEREPYDFTAMTDSANPHVFMNDEYLYGVRARVNVGFGLWQLAYASRQELGPASYAAARAAMMNHRSDGGRILGIVPDVLVVPPALEEKALYLLNTEHDAAGASNPWKGTAQIIVTPYVA